MESLHKEDIYCDPINPRSCALEFGPSSRGQRVKTGSNQGVEIDDPTLGIANFNSLRGIETVFLSYRLGEKQVNYWHHIDEGYECRRKMERELDIIKQ